MGHGEGWQYLQAGRFLERAGATAALLDAFFRDEADPEGMPPPLDQADWVALLRSCSALEGYCRQLHGGRPAGAGDRVPAAQRGVPAVGAVCRRAPRGGADGARPAAAATAAGRAERLSGRLRASLDYGQVDEILATSRTPYLTGVSRQCAQIHSAVDQSYISYSIEAALQA